MRIEDINRWDFKDPPVTETILGVSFAPLAGWDVPHFGLFWAAIREEYPSFDVVAPLSWSTEQKIEPAPIDAMIRCWFLARDGAGLIQVQKNCFFRNWKKGDGAYYPRFEKTRPLFEQDWTRFCLFLAGEGIGIPEPNLCEVSYINHIPRDQGSIATLFPGLGHDTPGWPSPESISSTARYPIPDGRGHVSINLRSAIRKTDDAPIYQLSVTARGAPTGPELPDIVEWFTLGRAWAKHAFRSHTSAHLHEFWGLHEKEQ